MLLRARPRPAQFFGTSRRLFTSDTHTEQIQDASPTTHEPAAPGPTRLKRSIRRKVLIDNGLQDEQVAASKSTSETAAEEKKSQSSTRQRRTRQVWKNVPVEVHREWMDEVGKALGVVHMEDWYKVRPEDAMEQPHGAVIRVDYHWSLPEALVKIYPEHEWHEWRFSKTPNGFWSLQTNRRRYFQWLMRRLDLKTMEDWYSVSKTMIAKNHGNGLLTHIFSHSPPRAIMDAFPEHKWQLWRFVRAPAGFWQDLTTRRQFFDHLKERKGYTKMEDWYNSQVEDFVEAGGSSLLALYNNRIADLLMETYPEHEWQPWLFARTLHLRRPEDHRIFMEWLGKKLGIKKMDEWYEVPSSIIRDNGGAPLFRKYGNRINLIQSVFPEHVWDPHSFKFTAND